VSSTFYGKSATQERTRPSLWKQFPTFGDPGNTSTPFVKQRRITCPSIIPMGSMS